MRTFKRVVAVSCFALSVCAAQSFAGEPDEGVALASEKGCVACHGKDGVAIAPIYPNLAGQWKRYLREQLHAYRSGRRQNNVMQGFAVGLTDEEIRRLADHYGAR